MHILKKRLLIIFYINLLFTQDLCEKLEFLCYICKKGVFFTQQQNRYNMFRMLFPFFVSIQFFIQVKHCISLLPTVISYFRKVQCNALMRLYYGIPLLDSPLHGMFLN